MRPRAENMVVVITGASRGIGRGTAKRFAERGASVVLAARSEGGLAGAAGGGEALAGGGRRGGAARRSAGRGASVVPAARSEGALLGAAAECEALGGEALAVPADVAEWGGVEELARRAVERFGRIDVWVNNAVGAAAGRAGGGGA